MPTGDTHIKLNDGYILLEDLESWYSEGFITSEDEIRFFNRNGKGPCEVHTIASLIQLNGKEFPFRSQPTLLKKDPPSNSLSFFGRPASQHPSNHSNQTNAVGSAGVKRSDVIYVKHRAPLTASGIPRSDPNEVFYGVNHQKSTSNSALPHYQNDLPGISDSYLDQIGDYNLEPPPGIPIPKQSNVIAQQCGYKFDSDQNVPMQVAASPPDSEQPSPQFQNDYYPEISSQRVDQMNIFNMDPPPGLSLPRTSDIVHLQHRGPRLDSAQNNEQSPVMISGAEFEESRSYPVVLPETSNLSVDQINTKNMEPPPGLYPSRLPDVNQEQQHNFAQNDTIPISASRDESDELTSVPHDLSQIYDFTVDQIRNDIIVPPPGLPILKSSDTTEELKPDSVPNDAVSITAFQDESEESAVNLTGSSDIRDDSAQTGQIETDSQNDDSKDDLHENIDSNLQDLESGLTDPNQSENSVKNTEADKPCEPKAEPESTEMPLILFNMVAGNAEYIFRDYPLLNNKNEPEGDRITGQEIIEEMEVLKSQMDMELWCKEYTTYFFFLSVKYSKIGMRDGIVICRFCRETRIVGHDVVLHLLSEKHIERLSKRNISRSSFSFWKTHIDMCKRTTAHRKLRKDNIPLFASFEYSEKERLDASEVDEIADLFSRIRDVEFMNDQCFVAVLFQIRGAPKFCNTCRVPMPILIYDFASHIFSKSHLSCLRGVSQADIDFWIEVLKIPIIESTNEITMSKPIFNVIPLWLSKRDYDPRRLEPSEIRLLVRLVGNLNPKNENSYLADFMDLMYLPDRCRLCDEYLGPRPRAIGFIKHLLSEKHLSTLTRIPEEHFNFWVNILNLEKSAKMVYSEDKIRVLTRRNTNPIPLFDFKLDSVLVPENQRAQKIDFLFKIYEMIKEEVWSSDPLKYGNSGESIDSKDVACFTCDTRKGAFKTQAQLISHVFSKRHVDYYLIKFGFSERAFLWWKTTLETLADIDSSQFELTTENLSDPPATPEEQVTLTNQEGKLFRDDSKSDEDDSTDEEFRDDEDEEKKGIEPNDRRIPLLDKPLPDVEMIPHTFHNPLAQLSITIRMNCTDEQKERGQNMLFSQCCCTFCDEGLQPIGFGNYLYLFSHVASRKHWEKMNKTAPVEEIAFWENWANCIINRRTLNNYPKVPMLSISDPEAEPVSKEKLDETLDECHAILEQKRSIRVLGREDKVFWTCEYCNTISKTVRLEEKVQVLYHIVSEEHREKMDHKATESDLEFWKKWAIELNEKWKINDEKKLAFYVKFYGETVEKPRNDPRVALLDTPNRGENLLTRSYKHRYNEIQKILTLCEPNQETLEALNCVCYHCPGTPKMTTKWEVMQHVFDGVHNLNIKYLGSKSDFEEYRKLLKPILEANPSLKLMQNLPVSTARKRAKLPYKLAMCKLPLFGCNYLVGEDKDFVGSFSCGPTNTQINFLDRLTITSVEENAKFFENPTKCHLCQLDISDYPIEAVAKHAFSPEHLDLYERYASCFYIEEFDWWMDKLKKEGHIEPPTKSVPIQEYCLGGLKPMDTHRVLSVFENFTDEQTELIVNIDEDKVKNYEVILQKKFSGCVYCNQWVLNPMDIISHHLSNHHFEKVRECHSVKNFDVEEIMVYVKMCQKGKKKKNL